MIVRSEELTSRGRGFPLLLAAMPRNEFFAGLFILGCANGIGARVVQAVNRLGWADALIGTFEISLIVWFACFIGVVFIFGDKADVIRSSDVAVGAGFLLLVILPIGGLSWLAVTMLSLYILFFTNASLALRTGAIILLATTVPMLWSRILFQFFANRILEIDAAFVGWLLGTHRTGNIVNFADKSGNLVILPSCSSLANMSLAFLCWVTMSQSVRHPWSPHDILWCLLACVTVVAVNVTRISLMGLSQSHYEAIHGQWADTFVNVIILGLTVGISLLGVRRELFFRA
jgi:exosortase/archaeosortase family protein